MARLSVLPTVNGVVPRPGGGSISGILLEPSLIKNVAKLGPGGDVFVAPVPVGQTSIYQVGVICKILKVYLQPIIRDRNEQEVVQGLFVELEGRQQARVNNYSFDGGHLYTDSVSLIDPKKLRPDYPVVSGAGWKPLGGYTDVKSPDDIRVTIYGVDIEDDRGVTISAKLGGIATPEEAHTVEHALIRALNDYALCSPKTLLASWQKEVAELKASIEAGFTLNLPELFGVTASGNCGNPLTNLAQFYLAKEFLSELSGGGNLVESLQSARLKTLSQLSSDFDISSKSGLGVLQGLKRGMQHMDRPTLEQRAAKILARFPVSPWD